VILTQGCRACATLRTLLRPSTGAPLPIGTTVQSIGTDRIITTPAAPASWSCVNGHPVGG
jgi:hypothetical protein